MTRAQFVEELRRAGGYRTPPPQVRYWLRRIRPVAAVRFHLACAGIVLAANRLARAGRYDSRAFADSSYATLRQVEIAGGEVEIEGYANLAGLREAVVYVGNHMSLLETFALPFLLLEAGEVCFVVKKSLLTYPAFGAVLRSTGPISVTRANPREDLRQVLEQGSGQLQAGRSVVIFPQSTRSHAFVETQFNSLGAKLAARAKVPVVPVALRTDFLANGRLIKDWGTVRPERPVRIAFGPVCRESDAKTLHREVVLFIRTRLKSWGVPVESPREAEDQDVVGVGGGTGQPAG